jgi:hypothetical protein
VAHAPLPVTLAAAAVIGVWLAVFAVRERHSPKLSVSPPANAGCPQSRGPTAPTRPLTSDH